MALSNDAVVLIHSLLVDRFFFFFFTTRYIESKGEKRILHMVCAVLTALFVRYVCTTVSKYVSSIECRPDALYI